MHESHAPDLLLRLSLPVARDFAGVASEAAAKIAELLGHSADDARSAGETIASLVAEVAPAGGAPADIVFEFHQSHGELRIDARCEGRSSRARHPLPT
jgi:hypothetical protein